MIKRPGPGSLALSLTRDPKPFVYQRVKRSWGREEKFLGIPDTGASHTIISKLVGEALTGSSIKLREYRNVRANKIKMEVWVKIGMFKLALCEKVVSPLPECFMVMDIMSDRGILSLLRMGKPKPVDEF